MKNTLRFVFIATLAHILGHRNAFTATRYLHPNAEQVQAMMEQV